MKKNRINTTSIREIKSSFKRFISLLVMSMLGVGVFVGISSTAPNMMKSIDTYYDNTNTYDIKLVSTLGLTNDDIEKINSLKEIKKAFGVYSKDVLVDDNENEFVIKIHSINENINQVEITKGRIPKKSNEIVVEEKLLKSQKIKIGDIISIKDEYTFKNKKFVIVGTVKSPLYIENVESSSGRGTTTIGNGKIDYYTYVNENAFDIDYYTEIYILVNNAKKELTNSSDYNILIKKAIKSIENIKTNREKSRYDDIYLEEENKIKKEEEKTVVELLNAKNNLDNTKKELDNGKKSLDDIKNQLNISKNKLDLLKKELDNNRIILDDINKKINNSKEELNLNQKYLNQVKEEIDTNKNLINKQLIDFNLTIDDLNDIARILEDEEIKRILIDNYIGIKEIIKNNEEIITNFVNVSDEGRTDDEINIFLENIGLKDIIYDSNDIEIIINLLKNGIKEVKNAVEEIYNKKSEIELIFDLMISNNDEINKLFLSIININNAIDNYNNSLNIYNKSLELYNTEYLKYKSGEEEYNKSYNLYLNYLDEYQQGLNQYNNNLKIYNTNLNLYNTKEKEYYNSKNMFENKIAEAYGELKNINKCTWHIYERLDDSGYLNFIDDGKSVSNLSKIFPTIFFVVAILISLISMSRMVEDDRLLIGTLKSLGFSNKHIRKKYLLYSSIATLSGSIIGSLFGFFLLPRYIWNLYKLLFNVPIYKYDYNPKNIIIGTILAIICICGTTLLTIKKVVKEKPSNLMRPKAPENGKRVLLEKIPFIWNKINFSNKITIRNLFRYKKRVLMTIVGIFGCTALMIAGFGIRDSIVDIPSKQYKEIFYYDEMAYIKGDSSSDELNNLFSSKHIKNRVDTKMDVSLVSNNYPLNVFVPDNEQDIKYILDLRDVKTKKKLVLEDNKIIISDKLSQLTNKLEGDKLIITDSSNKNHEFVISGVCENYVGHYVFMTKSTYEKYIGKYTTNVVYFNLDDLSNEKKLTKQLLNNENIMSIMSVNNTVTNVNNMLKTLNSVVLILIFLSGALSFVVLYNLSYINIVERKREIATLKVLGFTDKEVDNYITKETIILTILGITFGLLFGIFLSNIILDTVEIEKIRFMRIVNPISFIITTFIMLLFTFLVNIITHYTLKKIDMIESLKSVE